MWVSFIEWVLDLWLLPFLIVYIVCLPWRLGELWALAMSQYEQVPMNRDKVRGLRHVARDVGIFQMPKRIKVLYDLIRYLFKDYLTIVITLVLLATFWRTLNTLEILGTYAMRYKFCRCCCKSKNSDVIDYSVKDISFQLKLYREFVLLLRDLLFLLPTLVLTFVLIIRAKSLCVRLRRVQ